jgi:hypothetical protein
VWQPGDWARERVSTGGAYTRDISFMPSRFVTDGHDTDDKLILVHNQPAAVFVCLDGMHHDPEHKGWWHLEAGFSKCNSQKAPPAGARRTWNLS